MAQAATLGRRLAADDRKGKEFEEEEAAPAASCCCLLARCAEQQPGRIMRGEQAREKERQPGGRELTPVKRERELSVCARGARKEREKFRRRRREKRLTSRLDESEKGFLLHSREKKKRKKNSPRCSTTCSSPLRTWLRPRGRRSRYDLVVQHAHRTVLRREGRREEGSGSFFFPFSSSFRETECWRALG